MSRRKPAQRVRTTNYAPTVEQRTNALVSAAQQAARRAKRVKPDMDWDACIVRLRAMLDAMEN